MQKEKIRGYLISGDREMVVLGLILLNSLPREEQYSLYISLCTATYCGQHQERFYTQKYIEMKRTPVEPQFYVRGKYYIFLVLYSTISILKDESHIVKHVEILHL